MSIETCSPRASLLAASAAAFSMSCSVAAAADPVVRLTEAQSRYLEDCGGCHGIQGSSSRTDIPQLRGFVGWFLCTPAGREYIVRLPNVAFAAADDELLADVMNMVVFGFGAQSVPGWAVPYTASEVAQLRRKPLKNEPLAQMREVILEDAMSRCAGLSGEHEGS